MPKFNFTFFTDRILSYLALIFFKTLIVWGAYSLIVPAPFAFLPAVQFFEMIFVVIIFDLLFTTSVDAKNAMYLENINFVANMLYFKEKAIQNMVDAIMKGKKDGITISEIKTKKDDETIDKSGE